MNSRLRLACVMTSLLALTACATEVVPGIARRASTADISPPRVSASTTTGTTPSKVSLADADPCGLVTRPEAEGVLGRYRREPERKKLGTAAACSFTAQKAAFVLAVRTNTGLSGVQPNGGEIKETSVNGRAARELLDEMRSCGIFLGVTDSSRVDVVVNAVGTDHDPCALAKQVAELVEPRLP
ncbi:DUF3558 domain-containing protein [Saccharothrix obliqua]|uniref:DUF3558 domain-containing protein n=1 Tax=Saccharothrix obliqua TaxID=2861747 RepID=UPI001C5FDDE6|nr:DUF3558 domain-containing protein [Saccharothrix obliqua]MBW4716385.1 DUF3558 domain-containing protein [Saccharothrix obliqua]